MQIKAKNRATIWLDQYIRQGWARFGRKLFQIDIKTGVEKERMWKSSLKMFHLFSPQVSSWAVIISNGTILFNNQREEGKQTKIGTCLYCIEFPVNRR